MFYQAVVQSVLLFGADTWVLLPEMSRNLEGVRVGFLRQVMVQKDKQQREGNWRSMASERVLKEAENQTLGTYIEKRQAIVT